MRMGFNSNNYYANRKKKNYCFHCRKKLTSVDKGRSRDHGLLDDEMNSFPLCVNSAYFFAAKYIEDKGGIIVEE